MKFIESDILVLSNLNGDEILDSIEYAARTCYKSHDKITKDSAKKIVKYLIKHGHESQLEHVSVTFKVITDRAIQNEIVRHRIGTSFSVESSRYCNYGDKELEFILPNLPKDKLDQWVRIMTPQLEFCEQNYKYMLQKDFSPQFARACLPLCLKTEMVITMNLRALRHFFKLRLTNGAHPDIIKLANKLLIALKKEIPIVFDDI
jgi:thymidylate synthase (FAD)